MEREEALPSAMFDPASEVREREPRERGEEIASFWELGPREAEEHEGALNDNERIRVIISHQS